jgi:threonine/homoserine/homoserine lactone efflux protein
MSLFAAFVLFATVTLFTPGPNNAMLMASGLTYGWRRALPHLFGVVLGFGLMVALVGLGLGAVLAANPILYGVLKYVGAAYMLYLAWKIATAIPRGGEGDSRPNGRPISFVEAALFQWVNPKAWIMAVGAVSTYAGIAPFPWNVITIASVFTLVGFASSGAWVGLGAGLQRLITDPRRQRLVNVVLALGLALSIVPVFLDGANP